MILPLARAAFFIMIVGGALAAPRSPLAQSTIRDDFTGSQFSEHIWFVCQRMENEFSIVKAPGQAFRAAKMLVRPHTDLAFFGLRSQHSACANERGEYKPDEDERAELWEADAIRLRFGTEVWYQFSMFIDPDIKTNQGRLVIGQWKQSGEAGGKSPIVAQRFNGRAFTITIEQDNKGRNQNPKNTQCRIVVAADPKASKPVGSSEPHIGSFDPLVAADANASRPTGSSDPHFKLPAEVLFFSTSALEVPSIGHDIFEVVHGATASNPELVGAKACMTDLRVQSLNPLPSPFGRWMEMRYHIKATADESGFLEVWADGKPIVKVTGRFGFEGGTTGALQYFKFGPYRDHENYDSYAMLARYRRGPTLEDID